MIEYLLLTVAAFFAGMLNTVAGGGTFLTFPALVYTGAPLVAANATSAVAVFPGYPGGAAGFRGEIRAIDRGRLLSAMAATAAGGLVDRCCFSCPPTKPSRSWSRSFWRWPRLSLRSATAYGTS